MGALWLVIGGILAIIVGIIGLIKWWILFLKGLGAILPVLFILGGSIALFIGFTELKDSLKCKDDTEFPVMTPEDEEKEKEEESAHKETEDKSKRPIKTE